MCLGIPGRILDVETGAETGTVAMAGVAMARVDMGGVQRDVCLAYVPEATVGDYVLVHVGFAVRRMEAAEAQGTLALLRSAGVDLNDGGAPA
jgi:hydrogenase expression/formation protein HypC